MCHSNRTNLPRRSRYSDSFIGDALRPLDRDKAEQELAVHLRKATSPEETSPKQKHVRKCIVYTWDHKSSQSIKHPSRSSIHKMWICEQGNKSHHSLTTKQTIYRWEYTKCEWMLTVEWLSLHFGSHGHNFNPRASVYNNTCITTLVQNKQSKNFFPATFFYVNIAITLFTNTFTT